MMNDSNSSKKISWVQIVNAVVQALIAALTALGEAPAQTMSVNS